MAQIRVLKISGDGVPLEHSNLDEITFASFSVSGGGPVLDGTGLDMTTQQVKNVKDVLFSNPATGTINQSAGALIIDNIMAKDRDNLMAVSGSVLFQTVQNVSGEVDSFRLPSISGAPSASPEVAGYGYLVYDYVNNKPYLWTGTFWDDLSTVTSAENVEGNYTAGENIAAGDVVYISSANTVMKAKGDSTSKSYAIGVAVSSATTGNTVSIRKVGIMTAYSGLTVGAREYLSPGTAGAITETIPTGSGNTIVQVGYAKNTTTLDILIQQLGRRA